MKESILAISAHNDDHIIGAGGALAKYAKEGKRVFTIICSYGEQSHPHIKREVIIKKRVEESIKADRFIGGAGVAYLALKEGAFEEGFRRHKTIDQVKAIIAREKPSKVFTHDKDAHKDHREVNAFVMKLIKDGVITCPVYSFDIWSGVKLHKKNVPQLVVNITDTFSTKLNAFLLHESQRMAIFMLLWKIIVKDVLSGIIHGYKFAEVFYRLK